MRSIEEIFGTWRGACIYDKCAVCFDTKSPVYRKAACPTRTTEDKIVDAGEGFDYLGQRAEILKLRERRGGDEP